ncbi:MAG: hypothetical protein WC435_00665 [Candidatus Paceibacterota bacterium]
MPKTNIFFIFFLFLLIVFSAILMLIFRKEPWFIFIPLIFLFFKSTQIFSIRFERKMNDFIYKLEDLKDGEYEINGDLIPLKALSCLAIVLEKDGIKFLCKVPEISPGFVWKTPRESDKILIITDENSLHGEKKITSIL